MLSPALVLSLLACATTHTPPGLGELPADLPPWGAALFAKVGAMEGEITTMKTTIATQTDMLKMQGETIADNSARIQELGTHPPQAFPAKMSKQTLATGMPRVAGCNRSPRTHAATLPRCRRAPSLSCAPVARAARVATGGSRPGARSFQAPAAQ